MTRKSQAGANAAPDLPDQVSSSDQAMPNLPFTEFILLMALLMSLVAISTDAILPSLEVLGHELGQTAPQQLQKVVTFLFAGLATGQIVYGPLSDQIGRKKTIYIGLALFLVGNLLSLMAQDFDQLLIGRFLQGAGVAGPRIVLVALVRDLYAGRSMARIMSFIMGVFIFVPAIAPMMGQAVAHLAGWRSIFLVIMIMAIVGGLWVGIRQNETLVPSRRIPVNPTSLWRGIKIVFTTPSCIGYTIAAGVIMGPFLLYISTAQDLFQSTYKVGDQFPYYFAGLALSLGLASFLNSRLVMAFGMRFLARTALITLIVLASLILVFSYPMGFVPDLWLFLVLFCPLFFCMGLLFGNMNALAMEEVGHVAGLASAFIGAVSTFMAMGIATMLGQLYDGTILALCGSFALSGMLTLVLSQLTEYRRNRNIQAKEAPIR